MACGATLNENLELSHSVDSSSVGTASAQGVSPATSPVGLWQTVDDKTGEVRGEVRLFESKGVIYGKIEKGHRPQGDRPGLHEMHRRSARQTHSRPRCHSRSAPRRSRCLERRRDLGPGDRRYLPGHHSARRCRQQARRPRLDHGRPHRPQPDLAPRPGVISRPPAQRRRPAPHTPFRSGETHCRGARPGLLPAPARSDGPPKPAG